MHWWATISQRGADRTQVFEVLVWLGVLIVVVVVGGLVLLWLRRRMTVGEQASQTGSIFEDLRRLRAEGKISELEFEYLRRCMAAKAAGREPPPRPAELAEELVAPPGFDLTGEPIPPAVLEAMRRRQEEAE